MSYSGSSPGLAAQPPCAHCGKRRWQQQPIEGNQHGQVECVDVDLCEAEITRQLRIERGCKDCGGKIAPASEWCRSCMYFHRGEKTA